MKVTMDGPGSSNADRSATIDAGGMSSADIEATVDVRWAALSPFSVAIGVVMAAITKGMPEGSAAQALRAGWMPVLLQRS
jgi:hypothetical protein